MSKPLVSILVLWLLSEATVLGDDFPTEVARRKPATVSLEATGTLMPEDVVDINSQIGGQIQTLGADPHNRGKTVDFGTRVEVGTVLLQLDATLYQARVDKAKAQLGKARATLNAVRAQSVAGNVRKAEVEIAQADEELAQARLKEAQVMLAYTTIRSPIKGVIIDRRVTIGQNVGVDPKLASLFIIGRAVISSFGQMLEKQTLAKYVQGRP